MVTKVAVLTGKRGGFGAMKPMLRILRDSDDFELLLIVTDQHLNSKFGNTILEVENEFRVAAKVDMEQLDGSAVSRAKALGTCASKMANVLSTLAPDLCLLYGDRGEVLATAMVATSLRIPIGHLQGGDVSGSVDEQVRHAVTKLAHIHFASSKESAERIKMMGEEGWRIFITGDHHLDMPIAGEYAMPVEVANTLGLEMTRPIIIVLQHSETTAPEDSYKQMRETLIAVSTIDAQVVVIYPCSDVGYEGVIRAIDQYKNYPNFFIFKNLDAHIFWGLMAISSVLVGNSSAGIIESPIYRLPTVNIGRRQENRLCNSNVLHVEHDRKKITAAIQTALYDNFFIKQVEGVASMYGDGKAGIRTIEIIKQISFDNRLLIKKITY